MNKKTHVISLIAFVAILIGLGLFSLLTRKKWENTREDVLSDAKANLTKVLQEYKGATELTSDEESGTIELTFLNSGILFELDSADLKDSAKEFLAKLDEAMGGFTHLIVVGHADNSGSDAYNFQLSERRAESVRSELITLGADEKSIFSYGQGFYKPRTSNDTEEGRAQNRRVDIKLIYGNFVAVEGDTAVDEFYANLQGPMYGLWVLAAIALLGIIVNIGGASKKKEETSGAATPDKDATAPAPSAPSQDQTSV